MTTCHGTVAGLDPHREAAPRGTGLLRARIATLLSDPGVSERVRRRLARAAPIAAPDAAGTPPCFRAALPAWKRTTPILVKAGHCSSACGAVDCLCGRFPTRLDPEQIGRSRLERLAV